MVWIFRNCFGLTVKYFSRITPSVLGKKEKFYDNDFQKLFVSMTHADPEKRASIKEIKRSKWYNGGVFTNEQLTNEIDKFFR